MWDRRAEYISNHDGDTVTLKLDQGYDDEKTIDVRLLGVFAPEMGQPGSTECKKFVQDWFTSRVTTKTRWNFISTTIRMKVADHEQMTFTRYVGTITSTDTNDSLNLAISQFIADNNYGRGTGG